MTETEGLGARKAALRMLDLVLRRGSTLDSAAQGAHGLAPADRALAIAIAGEALRRLPDFDALIDGATRQPLPHDSKARMVLRLALAQKVGLGTPDHALVATALPLVDGGPRRLVHGVLGTLLRHGLPPIEAPLLPGAVEQRWTDSWGSPVVESARRQIAARPPLDLSFADDSSASSFCESGGGTSLAQRHVRLHSAAPVIELPGFGEGNWWVQDLAASIPARLIGDAPRSVLDLCAAPGGKTMQLAAARHRVTAVDSSAKRLARLSENLARTKLEAELVAADALDWVTGRNFGAILLDAPCSATGTFRRHPEVLYRARPDVIAASAELQARLLDRASAMVEPAGTLVYSVCSLERVEGEDRILAFLAAHRDFRLEPPTAAELPQGISGSSEGWLRILPGMLEQQGGLDGFFVARLVRSAG